MKKASKNVEGKVNQHHSDVSLLESFYRVNAIPGRCSVLAEREVPTETNK